MLLYIAWRGYDVIGRFITGTDERRGTTIDLIQSDSTPSRTLGSNRTATTTPHHDNIRVDPFHHNIVSFFMETYQALIWQCSGIESRNFRVEMTLKKSSQKTRRGDDSGSEDERHMRTRFAIFHLMEVSLDWKERDRCWNLWDL